MEKMKGQLQFSLGRALHARTHPGDLTPDAWAAREDVSHHLSTDQRMETGHGFTHFGTEQAGHEAVQGRSRGGHGEGTLFLHTRRLDTDRSKGVFTDSQANTAHETVATEQGLPVSDTVTGSATGEDGWMGSGPRIEKAADILRSGKSVTYRNDSEDVGTLSHVAPESAQHSYLEDVASSPNRPQQMREWAGVMAPRQFGTPATEGGDLDTDPPTLRTALQSQYFDEPSQLFGGDPPAIKRSLDTWTDVGVRK